MDKYFKLIDMMKCCLQGGIVPSAEIDSFILEMAKEIDKKKVLNEPTLIYERIYEELVWLKCEILNQNKDEQEKSL